jgi:hypothetical protein
MSDDIKAFDRSKLRSEYEARVKDILSGWSSNVDDPLILMSRLNEVALEIYGEALLSQFEEASNGFKLNHEHQLTNLKKATLDAADQISGRKSPVIEDALRAMILKLSEPLVEDLMFYSASFTQVRESNTRLFESQLAKMNTVRLWAIGFTLVNVGVVLGMILLLFFQASR